MVQDPGVRILIQSRHVKDENRGEGVEKVSSRKMATSELVGLGGQSEWCVLQMKSVVQIASDEHEVIEEGRDPESAVESDERRGERRTT